jgi:hypothetical protein
MKKFALILIAILLLLSACDTLKNPDDVDLDNGASLHTPNPQDIEGENGFIKKPPLDSQFFLRLNEEENEVYLPGNIAVKLIDIRDSRCPKDVQCVHAGFVDVVLEIDFVGEDPFEETLTLGASLEPDQKRFTVFYGNTYLTLQSVEPLPDANDSTKPEDKTVTLSVTRLALE